MDQLLKLKSMRMVFWFKQSYKNIYVRIYTIFLIVIISFSFLSKEAFANMVGYDCRYGTPNVDNSYKRFYYWQLFMSKDKKKATIKNSEIEFIQEGRDKKYIYLSSKDKTNWIRVNHSDCESNSIYEYLYNDYLYKLYKYDEKKSKFSRIGTLKNKDGLCAFVFLRTNLYDTENTNANHPASCKVKNYDQLANKYYIREGSGKYKQYIKRSESKYKKNDIKELSIFNKTFNELTIKDRKSIQSFLTSKKLYSNKIDGIFGPKTENAIKKYAKSLGIEVSLESKKKFQELLKNIIIISKQTNNKKIEISKPILIPKSKIYSCSAKDGTSKLLNLSYIDNEILGFITDQPNEKKQKKGYILQKNGQVYIGQKKDTTEFLRFEAPNKLELMSSSSSWDGDCMTNPISIANKIEKDKSPVPKKEKKINDIKTLVPIIESYNCYPENSNDNVHTTSRLLVISSLGNKYLGFVTGRSVADGKIDKVGYLLNKDGNVFIGRKRNSTDILKFGSSILKMKSFNEVWNGFCKKSLGPVAVSTKEIYLELFNKKEIKWEKQFTLNTASKEKKCSIKKLNNCSSDQLCNIATLGNEWDMSFIEFVDEAKKRGLTCGTKTYDSNKMSAVFKTLSFNQRRHVQAALKNLGFYKKSIDGIWGTGTNEAIKQYVLKNDLYSLTNNTNGSKKIFSVLRDDFEYVPPKVKNANSSNQSSGYRKLVANPMYSFEDTVSICKPEASYAESQAKRNIFSSRGCVGANYFLNQNCYNSSETIMRSIGNNLTAISAGRQAYSIALRSCLARFGWRLN